MKLFSCDECGQQLYFESTSCTQCKSRLGYDREQRELRVLREARGKAPEFVDKRGGESRVLRLCANALERDACNWLLPQASESPYCASCALSQVIPDLSVESNVVAWKRLESAKRRLLFTLEALGLPVVPKTEAPDTGRPWASSTRTRVGSPSARKVSASVVTWAPGMSARRSADIASALA